jgi:hypothetical protein
MNTVPMAERLVWAQVVRPQVPLVYLDINHLIGLARATVDPTGASPGYVALLDATRRAVAEQRAMFPLSGAHLWEISAIKSPRQRRDLANVMEELSGFRYLLGRSQIAQLEVEAGIQDILGEDPDPLAFPLVRSTFGHAMGVRGGMHIYNEDGSDGTEFARQSMGDAAYEKFIGEANYMVERGVLDGPSDEDVPMLRAEYGYAPEVPRQSAESSVAFELDLAERLDEDPQWRRGRLRDVVSAREIAHEWLDTINRVNQERARNGKHPVQADDDMRQLMSAMPHTQVAISVKTQYHRNPQHRWAINDIIDIDAASVAYPYCDAVFTDKAVRAALVNSSELRTIGTYLPRTPFDLSDWLNALPSLVLPNLLVPASSAATRRS